ncbi:hypothetical protein BH11PLA2_BH11PLA2_15570 [soil metagenome]
MYSLVLMSVMATSGDSTAFGGRFSGCHGCCGSVPVVVSSCCGSAPVSTGCCGSSCHGSCYGSCTGSCTGSSCHGTRTPLFHGVRYKSSCHGCTGSSCYGSSCNGCSGGVIYDMAPSVVMPPAATTPAAPVPATPTPMPMKTSSNAFITVELPANATLTVDGTVVAGEGTSRLFHTPNLAAGQNYFYEMTAEVVVNGKTESQARKVVLTAGENVTATFDVLIAKSTAKGTAVAAK